MEAQAIEQTPSKKTRKRLSVMEKLAKIEERQKALTREKKKLTAIDAKQQSARDRRKKIVLGSVVLKLVEAGRLKPDDLTAKLSTCDWTLFDEGYAKTLEAIQEIREDGGEGTTIGEMMPEIAEAQNETEKA
jgi:hypothetical protein